MYDRLLDYKTSNKILLYQFSIELIINLKNGLKYLHPYYYMHTVTIFIISKLKTMCDKIVAYETI